MPSDGYATCVRGRRVDAYRSDSRARGQGDSNDMDAEPDGQAAGVADPQ